MWVNLPWYLGQVIWQFCRLFLWLVLWGEESLEDTVKLLWAHCTARPVDVWAVRPSLQSTLGSYLPEQNPARSELSPAPRP